MRHAYFLIVAIACSAYADDPFSCVDPVVADAFLGDSYKGRGEYSTSIPDGFAALNVPSGLSLVGSETGNSMTTVVYIANKGAEESLDAAVAAMANAGWTENEAQNRLVTGGFQTLSRPKSAALCHDDYAGALSVIADHKSGQTFVSYVQHPTSQSCGAAEPAPIRHDPSEMMRLMPTFRLPEGAKATNTGMGGSSDEVSSHVDISGAMGRSELISSFENQIRDQGWEFQTSWSSHRSSGSVWVLDTVEDGLLIGTLHLFDTGTEPVRVRFSVNPADPTKGKGHGSWSGFSTSSLNKSE